MKSLLPLLLVLLAGCRSAGPTAPLPQPAAAQAPAVASAAPLPPARPVPVAPDPRSRQQAQFIEALINQNDALAARLAALQTAAEARPAATREPAAISTPPPAPVQPVPSPLDQAIAPNADGLIDLAAIENTGATDEPVNPFAVRTVPGEQTRELALKVGGIIQGAAPCAVVNDRLVQAGDRLEVFTVEEITASAVLVRFGPHRLRLPVSPVPTRIRLPL